MISLVLTLLVFAYLCLPYFACLYLHFYIHFFLLGLAGPYYWVLLGLTLLGLSYWVLLGLNGSYWVLLGLNGPYWALLTGPYWALF